MVNFMVKFNCARATSIAEVVELLNEPGLTSRPLAGGTDLVIYLRLQKPWFDRLVDISQIPELKIIKRQDGLVKVGSGVTFTQAAQSDLLRQAAPLLVEACQSVGSLQIRNRGTLGGNVVNAAACADSLPPLVCLGAVAHLQSAAGERCLPVSDFVTGPNKTDLRAGELLTHFSFEAPPDGVRSTFVKLGRRNAQSISRLSMAVMGRTNAQGVVDFVRVVPGAATPRLMRFKPVEQLLLDQEPAAKLLVKAGQKVAEVMVETTGQRWSTPYKEMAVQALAERTLWQVLCNGRAA
jgi:CO/xanthine dehydrogenase FAD-binding subunit